LAALGSQASIYLLESCNLCLSVCLFDPNSGTPGPIFLKF